MIQKQLKQLKLHQEVSAEVKSVVTSMSCSLLDGMHHRSSASSECFSWMQENMIHHVFGVRTR